MATLAELLAGAKATVAAKAQVEALKTRVKTAKSAPERDAAVTESLALQATLDWRPVALVYREVQWECDCLGCGVWPDGTFILHEHARLANSTRLARPRADGDQGLHLPRRILVERVQVSVCPSCSAAEGFLKPYIPPITVGGRRPVPLTADQRVYEAQWATLTQPETQDETASDDE